MTLLLKVRLKNWDFNFFKQNNRILHDLALQTKKATTRSENKKWCRLNQMTFHKNLVVFLFFTIKIKCIANVRNKYGTKE